MKIVVFFFVLTFCISLFLSQNVYASTDKISEELIPNLVGCGSLICETTDPGGGGFGYTFYIGDYDEATGFATYDAMHEKYTYRFKALNDGYYGIRVISEYTMYTLTVNVYDDDDESIASGYTNDNYLTYIEVEKDNYYSIVVVNTIEYPAENIIGEVYRFDDSYQGHPKLINSTSSINSTIDYVGDADYYTFVGNGMYNYLDFDCNGCSLSIYDSNGNELEYGVYDNKRIYPFVDTENYILMISSNYIQNYNFLFNHDLSDFIVDNYGQYFDSLYYRNSAIYEPSYLMDNTWRYDTVEIFYITDPGTADAFEADFIGRVFAPNTLDDSVKSGICTFVDFALKGVCSAISSADSIIDDIDNEVAINLLDDIRVIKWDYYDEETDTTRENPEFVSFVIILKYNNIGAFARDEYSYQVLPWNYNCLYYNEVDSSRSNAYFHLDEVIYGQFDVDYVDNSGYVS